jgi:hypothetical protein
MPDDKYFMFDELPAPVQQKFWDSYDEEEIKSLIGQAMAVKPEAKLEFAEFDHFDQSNPKEADGYIIYFHIKAVIDDKENDVVMSVPISEDGQTIGAFQVDNLDAKIKAGKYPNAVFDWKESKEALDWYNKWAKEKIGFDVWDFGVGSDTYVLVALPKGFNVKENAADLADNFNLSIGWIENGEIATPKTFEASIKAESEYLTFEELPETVKNGFWRFVHEKEFMDIVMRQDFMKEKIGEISEEEFKDDLDNSIEFDPECVDKEGAAIGQYGITCDFVIANNFMSAIINVGSQGEMKSVSLEELESKME